MHLFGLTGGIASGKSAIADRLSVELSAPVVEADRTRVFVDPDAAPQLEHAVLDAHVDANTLETRFVMRLS